MGFQIDKPGLRILRTELENELADLGKRHNLSISVGNASFIPGKTVTFKVECAAINSDGQVESKEAHAFKVYAADYGLQASDLGRTFKSRGRTFAISGLATRSSKYPILAICQEDGGEYKFAASSVKLFLKMPALGDVKL